MATMQFLSPAVGFAGGGTWTRSVKQRQWPSHYGVGEGKIISRPFALPARVTAVTFPDAQHGYLVGQHAMVYRYRIVPIDCTSQGMIGAAAP